ncbi:hypothetical protein LZK80_17360 [Rhizobium leguminosarum]|nr:hypothetical protein LZK80_17360 [Rhizobium leguminosarum]
MGERVSEKGSSRLPRANIRAGYGCPPAYLGVEAFPALQSLGLISDLGWTAAAETILWRDDPYEAGMNFAKDNRFIEALDVAQTSVPEEIAAEIRDIAAMPASEAAGLVDFARRYAHHDATKHEALVFCKTEVAACCLRCSQNDGGWATDGSPRSNANAPCFSS